MVRKRCHSQREEELLRGDTVRSLDRTMLWDGRPLRQLYPFLH
jgi:hypothetical protein